MHNSKTRLTNKAIVLIIVLILGLFIILSIFSGCIFSKKMRANMGFVVNKEDNYYSTNSETPNSFLYVNNATGEAQEYSWGYHDLYAEGIDSEKIDSYFTCLNSNFAIVTYKNDSFQGMHRNKLYKHVADELVYLNPETQNAELLFRSFAFETIIYGTLEYIIIYDAEHNVYRYISLKDNSIICEVESNINPFSGDYSRCVYETKQIFEVYKDNSVINKTTLVDSISLNPNQYLE